MVRQPLHHSNAPKIANLPKRPQLRPYQLIFTGPRHANRFEGPSPACLRLSVSGRSPPSSNDASLMQLCQALTREAEFATKYFFVMLAQARCGPPYRPVRVTIPRRHPRQSEFADARLIDFDEEVALTQMLACI